MSDPNKSIISVYYDNEIYISLLLVYSAKNFIKVVFPYPATPSIKRDFSTCKHLKHLNRFDWKLFDDVDIWDLLLSYCDD